MEERSRADSYDCRATNAVTRSPPTTHLIGPSALAGIDLDLNKDDLNAMNAGCDELSSAHACCDIGDVSDAFLQFDIEA